MAKASTNPVPAVTLVAADSGLVEGGEATGEVVPGVDGTEDGGEGEDPETTLICTF